MFILIKKNNHYINIILPSDKIIKFYRMIHVNNDRFNEDCQKFKELFEFKPNWNKILCYINKYNLKSLYNIFSPFSNNCFD